MVSSEMVPWYDRPARPFPAKRWLEQQPYPFVVSASMFARKRAAPLSCWQGVRRAFPALVWLRGKQQPTRAYEF